MGEEDKMLWLLLLGGLVVIFLVAVVVSYARDNRSSRYNMPTTFVGEEGFMDYDVGEGNGHD